MNMRSEFLCLMACCRPTQVAFLAKQVGIERNRASDLSGGLCPMFKADLDMGGIMVRNRADLQERSWATHFERTPSAMDLQHIVS